MARSKVTITSPKGIELLKNAIFDLGEKAADKVVEIAAQNAPVDTGNYRDQIENKGNGLVIAQAQYSAHLEYGTADHGPVKAKALKWVKNGEVHFAKKVKGIKPFATMRNAAAQTQKEINQIWKEALRDNGL